MALSFVKEALEAVGSCARAGGWNGVVLGAEVGTSNRYWTGYLAGVLALLWHLGRGKT